MNSFNIILNRRTLIYLLLASWIAANTSSQAASSEPKFVPLMQVVPMPYHLASFQRDGVELTRYHFGPGLHRPFLFPIVGPSGRSLTRMGHPHDPESHSHHNSVWISHNNVNGTSFWSDSSKGKIRHKRIVEFEDADEHSSLVVENEWINSDSNALLLETRKVRVLPLSNREWLLTIDMEFKANNRTVTLGKTPFEIIGVNDGGGKIRNSDGAVNEKEAFWKHARWVDYSGTITNEKLEGITLFDHPDNPNFPACFQVRNDGWMGASLTFDGPRNIRSDKPLQLRYDLYVHSDMKSSEAIEAEWRRFIKIPPANSK